MQYSLGIDIGSVSVKAALLDEQGRLAEQVYQRHMGRPLEIACQILKDLIAQYQPTIAFTGNGGRLAAEILHLPYQNEIAAQVKAAQKAYPEARSLIEIGGEDSRLIILEEKAGSTYLKDFAMNSICAAGTGSFLDQQASRLGVEIEDFGGQALKSQTPPRIAGRCSVFAKTDMIHLQQKATPVFDILAGLCFAMARNFVSVICRGKEIALPVYFAGGVAENQGMVRAFREILNLSEEQLIVPPEHKISGALGAAWFVHELKEKPLLPELAKLEEYLSRPPQDTHRLKPLELKSQVQGYPFTAQEFTGKIPCYLGVDIGSISTNLVVMDEARQVLGKCYLMTAGKPLEAVRAGMQELSEKLADKIEIKGVCTTGSGRYLVGDYLGADLIKNEITAQARAAMEIDPQVDTILEIGGQDSKYICVDNGMIADFEMNKVCAAGTGSFLEEQAEKLGIDIKGEFSDLALASERPCPLGERCTVFMESSLVAQKLKGHKKEDLTAGLAYSIAENYLNRVVANKKIGKRIFFQGGVAFNKSVMSAFEQILKKTITVPEHHEVTGAIGCALMAREYVKNHDIKISRFKGWDLSKRAYRLSSFECKACANACEVNKVEIDGESPLFYGGRCEKYELRRRVVDEKIPDLFAERENLLLELYKEPLPEEVQIGIPRVMYFWENLPFWLKFFAELGLKVKLSPPNHAQIVKRGLELTLSESCFPIKSAHGAVEDLINQGIKNIFIPCVVQLIPTHSGFSESVSCPYAQALPYIINSALAPDKRGVKVLAPIVDFRSGEKDMVKELAKVLKPFGVKPDRVKKAVSAGTAAQNEFAEKLKARGREILDNLQEKALVIVSRAYNGCDSGLNLNLPRKIRELGVLPIPLDMLDTEQVPLWEEFADLTWKNGQRILSSAELIRHNPQLEAVYITNFSCGPDSFLLGFFQRMMGEKTFLQLEIDEHSSDVGVITRLEAFLDSKEKLVDAISDRVKLRRKTVDVKEKRTIYFPHMCDHAHLLAAAFRCSGLPAEVLPPSDQESLKLGKLYTSGKECFPCLVTTGDMLKFTRKPGFDPDKSAFFMPSAGGGCRFGYYNILHRFVLNEQGLDEVPIFAPNQNEDFYQTLASMGDDLIRRSWQGAVSADILSKALFQTRPYELKKGETDRVYKAGLDKLVKALESGADMAPVMKEIRAEFQSIPADRTRPKPRVGIIGEIFVRLHTFSNQQLIEKIEELGGEVWMAPFTEWIFYINLLQRIDTKKNLKLKDYFYNCMVDREMHKEEEKLLKPWEGYLKNLHEVKVDKCLEYAEAYLDPAFRGESILSIGKAIDFYHQGLSGVINVMPFTCMPGTISSGILKRFQQEHQGIPCLNLAFDGQLDGSLMLRLEAFVYQCREYRERNFTGVGK